MYNLNFTKQKTAQKNYTQKKHYAKKKNIYKKECANQLHKNNTCTKIKIKPDLFVRFAFVCFYICCCFFWFCICFCFIVFEFVFFASVFLHGCFECFSFFACVLTFCFCMFSFLLFWNNFFFTRWKHGINSRFLHADVNPKSPCLVFANIYSSLLMYEGVSQSKFRRTINSEDGEYKVVFVKIVDAAPRKGAATTDQDLIHAEEFRREDSQTESIMSIPWQAQQTNAFVRKTARIEITVAAPNSTSLRIKMWYDDTQNIQKTSGFIKWIGTVLMYSVTWKHRCVLTRNAFLTMRTERLAPKQSRDRVSGDGRELSRSEICFSAADKSKATATGRTESPLWRMSYNSSYLSSMSARVKLECPQL